MNGRSHEVDLVPVRIEIRHKRFACIGGARLLIERDIALSDLGLDVQTSEIEQVRIHQMRRHDVAHCGKHRLDPAFFGAIPFVDHIFHGLALQIVLRTA